MTQCQHGLMSLPNKIKVVPNINHHVFFLTTGHIKSPAFCSFLSHFVTVLFSSMTSLQKEEFFDLVATAQGRRLDDQRASFRGSIKQLSLSVKKPAPVPVPKDDLYDMILTTQAQGRLEDQRSRAPGPMDDEDFFSLLLRVQGGRMDEQRTELPRLLQT
uniref:Uncharacterized protein n=1 Tax=Amphilophus citrinellus TaxID=61819 RepID=A0A3Q0QX77_AMPCI